MTSVLSINSIKNWTVYKTVSDHAQKIEQKLFDTIPDSMLTKKKTLDNIDWIGKKITSPENRLILGVTALASQPFIDLNNKKVDKETRKVSVARTVAKILAGTLTGVLIRRGCIKWVDAMSKVAKEGEKLPKYKQFFTPTRLINEIKDADKFEQYKNVLGTVVALGVMLFTNFLIDAPLTKYLTNLFVDKANQHQKEGGK
ncbi:MAG: hypothetical protein LKG27_05855 [Clostridiaceae bacterium]|jgi:hypothetical protein|nr:hypothetical protein [Clostridiaceae bacterium]